MIVYPAIVVGLLFMAIYSERRHIKKLLDHLRPSENGYGTITRKEIVQPRTESYTSVQFRPHEEWGGGYHYEIPETVEIPAEFLLYIHISGVFACVDVSPKLYEQVNEGDRLAVRYRRGRSPKEVRVLSVSYS